MNYNKSLSKNKQFEVQIEGRGFTSAWFEISVSWTDQCDHAGLDFILGCKLFYLGIQLYDSRHWNYKENRYYEYNDAGEGR